MFLRNWYNKLGMLFLYHSYSSSPESFADGNLVLKAVDGSYIYKISNASERGGILNPNGIYGLFLGNNITAESPSAYTSYSPHFVFGSGTTPVTFDDYKLDSALLSNISVSTKITGSFNYDATSNKYSYPISMVITNTSSSSQTITEVGIASSAGGKDGGVLAYREVLATPITLAAGESVTYTHNFEFTMPTIS